MGASHHVVAAFGRGYLPETDVHWFYADSPDPPAQPERPGPPGWAHRRAGAAGAGADLPGRGYEVDPRTGQILVAPYVPPPAQPIREVLALDGRSVASGAYSYPQPVGAYSAPRAMALARRNG